MCALPDSFNAIQVFTNAFCEPVAYRTIKSEQQQALFFTVLFKQSFIFIMYKFVHGIIVLFDTI